MKTEDTEALGRQRAKPSQIKAWYSRPTCKNCSYLCAPVHNTVTCMNARKMEFMWCVPPRCHHQLPVDQLTIQSTTVASRESVRDLSVYLNSDMSIHKHVTQLVRSCYGILRQLRSIRRSLTRTALTTLVSSFIMSKVDYFVTLSWQVYHNVNWTVYSRSSMRLLTCQQTLANTTT